MQMTSSDRFGLFLTARSDGPAVRASDLSDIEDGLRGVAGLSRAHLYTPATAARSYLDDGAPPRLMLECAFGALGALEAALADGGPLASTLGTLAVSQQAMALRHYAVPEPEPKPGPLAGPAERCTYVVTYDGEAEDANAWLSHYLAHHTVIMARFPAIRAIMVASRIDWCSAVAWPRDRALQRNRVVFDDPAALDAALASPVRQEMRADFQRLPPFSGRVSHFPMTTRTIVAEGTRQ